MGIGGLGKTTLAKVVYNDLRVKDHFAVKAWYYLGDRYDICSVLKSVIESITDENWKRGNDLQDLQKGLGEAISQRRMLLVLDDYASIDSQFEDKLKSALCSSSGSGSCILLTSRSIPVTSEFSTPQPYHLRSLNEDDAWEMFSRRAFSNGQERPEFVALGRDIVKICKGLPLAVKVMSGLMRTKTTLADWETVTKG
ncbi:hypothetical protein C2845_PM09G20670 [Panicum miliaceum]|uniref:NB-ARC domain-containing protein n=1 Tax=Panicum miliaceum TaxID=4540 RepID=A0A3L6RWF9_PANMI|nr:hypothetical protein C2845_PM09G20670 [Panicum miliaceum]